MPAITLNTSVSVMMPTISLRAFTTGRLPMCFSTSIRAALRRLARGEMQLTGARMISSTGTSAGPKFAAASSRSRSATMPTTRPASTTGRWCTLWWRIRSNAAWNSVSRATATTGLAHVVAYQHVSGRSGPTA